MHDFYNDYESNFISSRFDELSKNGEKFENSKTENHKTSVKLIR